MKISCRRTSKERLNYTQEYALKHQGKILLSGLMVFLILLPSLPTASAPSQLQRPQYPDVNKGRGKKRGTDAKEKLSPELAILFDQYTGGDAGSHYKFEAEHLRELFNVGEGSNPSVVVTIRVTKSADASELKTHRAKIYLRSDDLVVADVPVRALERLAREKFVLSVVATKATQVPSLQSIVPPSSFKPPSDHPVTNAKTSSTVVHSPAAFNAGGLTGKGVIVGVIDTGIDWRHEDFMKQDGTSRILYLWDMTDNSFETSSGKIGSQPPILEGGNVPGPGTLYTNKQINDALQGQSAVNSSDNFGHGTVTAGTAAGNGRATANGVPAGTYMGVAPQADLIIVKAGDCGSFDDSYILGTKWIAQVAQERRQPVVINHSLGGHFSPHDGSEAAEQLMNKISGAGKPGTVLTVSAGNEGKYSLHGTGRFGPRRPGQADIDGAPLEVSISQRTKNQTWLNGYFDTRDDWGLVVRGSGSFLVDQIGRPFNLYIFKVKDEIKVQLPDGVKEPDYFDELADLILNKSRLAAPGEKTDRLWFPLPPGNYFVWGFGATGRVVSGSFDLYTPFYTQGSFTIGAVKRMMVGSPGNAANVITVGSYDFRLAWENQPGGQTIYNLSLERISDYSSPGGRRDDGIFKPEITAPARYTISSMSSEAKPGSTACQGQNMGTAGWTAVTRDGKHMAWSGTSAAAPYVAGVIALMLQKNPNLDAAQIKNILIKTARSDHKFVGTVPNPEWGYGKLNPSAALSATTAHRDRKPRH
jgi:minor extracellular serine protease Vpr